MNYNQFDEEEFRQVRTPEPPAGEQLEQADFPEEGETDIPEAELPAPTPLPRPTRSVRPAPQHHHHQSLLEDDDDGFFAKHRVKIIFAAMLLVVGALSFLVKPGKGSGPSKPAQQIVSIKLPPLPPPPPPPKVQPPPPKQEQKMEDQPREVVEEKRVEAPKKQEAPLETLGTGIKGDGPGLSGLGAAGNGGGFGGAGAGHGGSKWGWYAGQVQTRVVEALRRNKSTKTCSLQIKVRIWPDATGHVLRAKIDGSTGDRALDSALQNEVLTGLQLEPPPPGMPMPIVMRLTASRQR